MSGALLNEPYLKSCTLENENLGFKTSAIRPFDPNIIPEHNYINDFLLDIFTYGRAFVIREVSAKTSKFSLVPKLKVLNIHFVPISSRRR